MDIFIIADDDTSESLKNSIQKFGHRVVGRNVNITKALNLIDEIKPNIVIQSLSSIDENRWVELDKVIRTKGLSVLYIISRSQEEVLKKELPRKSVNYIIQPFSDEELNHAIEDSLSSSIIDETGYEIHLMEHLLNEVNFAFILTDKVGIISYINKSAIELLDIENKNSTLRGFLLQDVVNLLDETTENPIHLIFSSQNQPSDKTYSEAILLTHRGQKLNVLYTFKPLHNLAEEMIGFLLSFQDISPLKELFAILQRKNELLEARLTERTNNLLNQNILLEKEINQRLRFEKELEQALLKAKESNRFRSNIVSTLSHEFRTPLTTIQSSVDIIERLIGNSPENDKIHKHFLQIKKSIKTLSEMLNDVLEIEKADNQAELELSVIKPLDFFEELIDNYRLGIGSKHNIDFQHNAMPMEIQTNPKLLSQIMSNLVSNACKYSEEHTTVRIIVLFKENELQIRVSDEGKGISNEDLPHIFETFYRSKSVENIPGSGLGLSIIKKAIDALHGEIKVKTSINKGTRFTIHLPL